MKRKAAHHVYLSARACTRGPAHSLMPHDLSTLLMRTTLAAAGVLLKRHSSSMPLELVARSSAVCATDSPAATSIPERSNHTCDHVLAASESATRHVQPQPRRSRILRACMRASDANHAAQASLWPALRRRTHAEALSALEYSHARQIQSVAGPSQGATQRSLASGQEGGGQSASELGRRTMRGAVRAAVGSLLGLGAHGPRASSTSRPMSAVRASVGLPASGTAAHYPGSSGVCVTACREPAAKAPCPARPSEGLSASSRSASGLCRAETCGTSAAHAAAGDDRMPAGSGPAVTAPVSAAGQGRRSMAALTRRTYATPPAAHASATSVRSGRNTLNEVQPTPASQAPWPMHTPAPELTSSGMHAQLNAVEAQLLGAQSMLRGMAAQLAIAQHSHAAAAQQTYSRDGSQSSRTLPAARSASGGGSDAPISAATASESVRAHEHTHADLLAASVSNRSSAPSDAYEAASALSTLLSTPDCLESSCSGTLSGSVLRSMSERSSLLHHDDPSLDVSSRALSFVHGPPVHSDRSMSGEDEGDTTLPLSARMQLLAQQHSMDLLTRSAYSSTSAQTSRPRSTASSSASSSHSTLRAPQRPLYADAASGTSEPHISEVLRRQRLQRNARRDGSVQDPAAVSDAAAAASRARSRAQSPVPVLARARSRDSGVPPMSAPFYDFLLRSTRLLLPPHMRTPPPVGAPASGLDGVLPDGSTSPAQRWAPRALATLRAPTPQGNALEDALFTGRTFHGHLVGAPAEVLPCAPADAMRIEEATMVELVQALPGVDVEASIVHSVLDALQGRATCCRMAAVWWPGLQVPGVGDKQSVLCADESDSQNVAKRTVASLVQLGEQPDVTPVIEN